MIRSILLPASLLLLSAPAAADAYRVSYRGNAMPEQTGWQYYWGNEQGYFQGDPPDRQIVEYAGNSLLRIDTSHDPLNFAYFKWARPNALDPAPGELFFAQWRLQVVEVTSQPLDSAVGVHSDEGWSVGFDFTETLVRNSYFPHLSAAIAPGCFHDYVLLSEDMRLYQFFVDGELAFEGPFLSPSGGEQYRSWVGWGPGELGGSDIAEWDYFQFGVIGSGPNMGGSLDPVAVIPAPEPAPEPASFCLLVVGFLVCHPRRRVWVVSANTVSKGE